MSLPKADKSEPVVQQAVLLPKSEETEAYAKVYGRPLFVVPGSQLGRGPVAGPGAYQLPVTWQQVSGQHCKFCWDAEQVPGISSVVCGTAGIRLVTAADS